MLRGKAVVVLMLMAGGIAPAWAQQLPAISGIVLDAYSRRPVIGATVEWNELRVVTDRDGRFRLTVPRGATRVRIVAEGYLPEQVDVTVGAQLVTIEVLLLNRAQFKEEIVVIAGKTRDAQAPISTEVSPLEVRSVAGAAENVFRVLQTLPGVNATEDFGSRLSVRGGGPDQNLTIMDGVEIHNPYRLFGLTSAFNPETVQAFELTSGGFSPKYGDRLSSLLLIENRQGTQRQKLAGSASLSLTDANVIVEGALPGKMKGSWLVSGRRTYYDLIANRITGTTLPSFGDIQAKGVWEVRAGQRVSVFALRSRESTDANFTDTAKNNRFGFTNAGSNDLVSLSFFSTIGRRATSRTIASWYSYTDELGAIGNLRNEAARSNAPGDAAFARSTLAFTRQTSVRDISLRQELGLTASARHFVEAGFEAHVLSTGWNWNISGDRNTSEANGSSARGGTSLPAVLESTNDATRAGLWLVDRYQPFGRVTLEPGLRIDWSGLARETVVSPRFAVSVDLGGGNRLRGSVGRFAQSPGYEKLLQSDYFVDLSGAGARGLKSEQSVHVLGSLEHRFAPGLVARVEGYYKSFDRLIVGRLEMPAETAARIAPYAFPPALAASVPTAAQITSTPVNGATGRAYGIDVFVAHQPTDSAERLAGWASYTFGKADIDSYGRRYAFDYDRRHALSLVGTYRMMRGLELAATLRIASGFPYTPAVGLRVAAVAETDATGAVVRYVPQVDVNGLYVWTTDPGGVENLNAGRLPVFVRLDFRTTFKPRWSGNRWQFYVEVINALNRSNVGGFDTVLQYNPVGDRPLLTYTASGGLPLLPSVGVRYRF
ncbi:MAG: TonB-dependent receptor plug domain-containing protein [Acidobacteria bacterium]|nr:TonB-dependent receptor plug domain-containing protein [Acidobacteriota bacterium]